MGSCRLPLKTRPAAGKSPRIRCFSQLSPHPFRSDFAILSHRVPVCFPPFSHHLPSYQHISSGFSHSFPYIFPLKTLHVSAFGTSQSPASLSFRFRHCQRHLAARVAREICAGALMQLHAWLVSRRCGKHRETGDNH